MRPVALINGPFFHHIDHLAPLSILLNCPLLVDDETTYTLTTTYYPDVKVALQQIDLIDLAHSYDLLILSTKFAATELEKAFYALGITHMRFCYCPHGRHDKGITNPSERGIMNQDIALLYSPSQKTLLEESDAKETLVIGNYRLHYYQQHKPFLDKKIDETIFQHFGKIQPTILYAPTWADQDNSTTFFTHYQTLLSALPSDYNLIIKLHPLLEKYHPAFAHHALSYHLTQPNIQVVLEMPLIYPLLNRIDIYLGDYSAVGYDFLYFDRPLYFLSHVKLPLHEAGTIIADPKEIFVKQEDRHSTTRKRLYNEAFAPYTELSLSPCQNSRYKRIKRKDAET